jgi:hypothetical protein
VLRRTIVHGLALLILAGVAGQAGQEEGATRPLQYRAAGAQDARQEVGPCPIRWKAAYYQHGDTDPVRRIIRCAVRRWAVPGGVTQAFSVAGCEDGFRPDAFNPTGCSGYGCFSIYQQHGRWWYPRAEALLPDRWEVGHGPFNARANVLVSVQMVHRSWSWSRDWPGCS